MEVSKKQSTECKIQARISSGKNNVCEKPIYKTVVKLNFLFKSETGGIRKVDHRNDRNIGKEENDRYEKNWTERLE